MPNPPTAAPAVIRALMLQWEIWSTAVKIATRQIPPTRTPPGAALLLTVTKLPATLMSPVPCATESIFRGRLKAASGELAMIVIRSALPWFLQTVPPVTTIHRTAPHPPVTHGRTVTALTACMTACQGWRAFAAPVTAVPAPTPISISIRLRRPAFPGWLPMMPSQAYLRIIR